MLATIEGMKLYQFLISLTTLIVLIITLGDVLNLSTGLLVLLTLLGHIMLIFTVIAVLKTPRKSNKTFDEYFYEDL
ncbi:MAG TPA: hypothetical protein VFW11_02815 [Cyclobacteriaceae bacterium]|nr:hypothetical protein [Cyclobacteriaceae bacterium]